MGNQQILLRLTYAYTTKLNVATSILEGRGGS